MYRSVAQFGAWALARAQKTSIEIMDDDEVSIISTESSMDSEDDNNKVAKEKQEGRAPTNGQKPNSSPSDQVGKAGDPLPPFHKHMIRQKVDRHGSIFPLDPPHKLQALQVSPNEVGVIKRGPVEKWMNAKTQWDSKFASQKRKAQKRRMVEMSKGYLTFGDGDLPPPSALAGRRTADMPKEKKIKRSMGLSLWSLWGSSHDEKTVSSKY